jgi:drug/metabolite transporter (DMT)-like permease
VIVSFASVLAWVWLLRRYLASRLGVLSFMTPVFGIVLGIWLLDEPLEASFIAGSGLVLGGILLVSGCGWLRQWLGGRRTAPADKIAACAGD